MKYNILQRLLQAAAVLLGVALLIFVMLRIVPGNPIATMMGEHADAATIERMTAELGLDQPIPAQFCRYIADAFRGDFGTSYSLGKPNCSLNNTVCRRMEDSPFAVCHSNTSADCS